MTPTVAALYVLEDGPYSNRPDVDAWPESRDARLYAGPYPVVAHPPCSSWCQLAPVNQKRYGHKVGDDGGCFAAALAAVNKWGGVLEHPADSYAWPAFGLLRPSRGAWQRSLDGAWVTEVCQRAYGHRARKRTWLYYRGESTPPELDWSCPEPEATVSFLCNHGDSGLPRLSKREAKTTPPAFLEVLLRLARRAGEQHTCDVEDWCVPCDDGPEAA
jgi:hypothetical protein